MAAVAARAMLPQARRVRGVRRETSDTVTLTLDAPGVPFEPGQFNMLYAFAAGEVAISMSGDPKRTGESVHTIKAVGAATRALAELDAGGTVGVRGPYGTPWPVGAARGQDLVIVAGGLGLAPLRPVVYHVLSRRADYGRVTVLVGARTPDDLLFQEEMTRWSGSGALDVRTIVDRAAPGWKGRVGVVPALLADVTLDNRRTLAFVCGPEVMMRFTVRALAGHGLADDRIFLSLERNMKCAVGFCGHCQFGPSFICKDGPVFSFDALRPRFSTREL
jgi:NAD(P)H-flavin reductase